MLTRIIHVTNKKKIHIILLIIVLIINNPILDFEDTKKSCEMLPCSALKLKMLNQGTKVPFMRIFIPKAFGRRLNFLANNPGYSQTYLKFYNLIHHN